jgi:hypothetical protein
MPKSEQIDVRAEYIDVAALLKTKPKRKKKNEVPPPFIPYANPLLLFSGGMDSTYMLWKALETGPVHTLYAFGGQSVIKEHAEKKARDRIMNYMAKHRPFPILSDDEIKIRGVVQCPTDAWEQPYSWFMAALQSIHPTRMSEVQIGTVLNDDGAPYCGRLQVAWENLLRVIYPQNATVPLLKFPQWNLLKTQIYNELPEALRKMTWVCEVPLWKRERAVPCGCCKPCKTAALTKHYAENGVYPPRWQVHHRRFIAWQEVQGIDTSLPLPSSLLRDKPDNA